MRLFLNPDMALSLTLYQSPTLPLSGGALSESFDTALTLFTFVVLLLGKRRRAQFVFVNSFVTWSCIAVAALLTLLRTVEQVHETNGKW